MKNLKTITFNVLSCLFGTALIGGIVLFFRSFDHPTRYLIVTNGKYYCVAHQIGFWSKPTVYDDTRFELYSMAEAQMKAMIASEAEKIWKETKE